MFLEFFNIMSLEDKRFHVDLFYIWNKSAIKNKVEKEIWGSVLTTLFKGCPSDRMRNELVLSTKFIPLEYIKTIGKLEDSIQSSMFKRLVINNEVDLGAIFIKENILLADFLSTYLSSFPVDIELAKELIALAKDNKIYAGQIAKALEQWRGKLNSCAGSLASGDAYVNGLIAKHTGLDIQITQTLLRMNELQIAETLGQWHEAKLTLDPRIVSEIILDKIKTPSNKSSTVFQIFFN